FSTPPIWLHLPVNNLSVNERVGLEIVHFYLPKSLPFIMPLTYALQNIKVDGTQLPKGMLQTNLQLEVGNEGYDEGARILAAFFKKELEKFLTPDLNPLGRRIIECCMNDGTVEDYFNLIPRL
ncbi:MAG: DUF4914 family protein, partial [Firmicutes bacterium]|nr:DUF4914 family protein [Bacillota bacterium]